MGDCPYAPYSTPFCVKLLNPTSECAEQNDCSVTNVYIYMIKWIKYYDNNNKIIKSINYLIRENDTEFDLMNMAIKMKKYE